jgi:hypothetical protein
MMVAIAIIIVIIAISVASTILAFVTFVVTLAFVISIGIIALSIGVDSFPPLLLWAAPSWFPFPPRYVGQIKVIKKKLKLVKL